MPNYEISMSVYVQASDQKDAERMALALKHSIEERYIGIDEVIIDMPPRIEEPEPMPKVVTLIGGEQVIAHDKENCEGESCAIHNPSQHSMSNFPQHWRSDRKIMERICPHGIGHPDPDHMAFYAKTHTPEDTIAEGVHGCDGCCNPERENENVATDN